MGNCLRGGRTSPDDVSLLRTENGDNESGGGPPDAQAIPHGEAAGHNIGPPPPYQEGPVFHPSPGVNRLASQLTEDEQIKIAKRMGLIQLLPSEVFDGSKKLPLECVICMGDFVVGDTIRFLPCCHAYHRECIDDWLMRSFTCPSCMESLDVALLGAYEWVPLTRDSRDTLMSSPDAAGGGSGTGNGVGDAIRHDSIQSIRSRGMPVVSPQSLRADSRGSITGTRLDSAGVRSSSGPISSDQSHSRAQSRAETRRGAQSARSTHSRVRRHAPTGDSQSLPQSRVQSPHGDVS